MLGLILVTVAIGVVVSLLSAGFFIGYSTFTKDFIKQDVIKQTRLEEGTEQYERWIELPVPLEFKIYAFNVTNPHEIVNEGAIPIVHEVGPFVYHEHFHKQRINREEKHDTFIYNQFLKMDFQRKLSAYGDDFKITVPNLPLQGIFQNEEEGTLPASIQNMEIDRLWPQAFDNDGIFVTMPVKKFFFEGYTFCDTRRKKGLRKGWNGALGRVKKLFCNQVRELASSNPTIKVEENLLRFSMFKHKENNTNGRLEILAGMKDISKLGQIRTWNGESHLNTWMNGPESTCNTLRGTDSTIYPPWTFSGNTSTVFTFNTDICRTVKLNTAGEVNFKGIPGVKAVMGPENMENTGENSCYCIRKTRDLAGDRDCFPKGFCDMGNCLKAPIVISFPHMLWGDQLYRDSVKGLAPSEEKHISFLAIEPITGTRLQGRKRMQFNIPLRPIKPIQATHNLPAAMLPVLWVEESFDLSDDMVDKVKEDYFNKLFMLDVTGYALIGSGLVGGTIIAMYLLFPRY